MQLFSLRPWVRIGNVYWLKFSGSIHEKAENIERNIWRWDSFADLTINNLHGRPDVAMRSPHLHRLCVYCTKCTVHNDTDDVGTGWAENMSPPHPHPQELASPLGTLQEEIHRIMVSRGLSYKLGWFLTKTFSTVLTLLCWRLTLVTKINIIRCHTYTYGMQWMDNEEMHHRMATNDCNDTW